MKTIFNCKLLIRNSLMAIVVVTMSSTLVAQEKKATDVKPFKVVVKPTANGIEMKSIEGSAWLSLTFDLSNLRPQAIDEYGMTELRSVSTDKAANLADYLFTITKTENEIIIKGIEGTAWTDLRFSLSDNKKQWIDEFGMTKRK